MTYDKVQRWVHSLPGSICILFLLFGASGMLPQSAQAAQAKSVLVLYDSSGTWGKNGWIYAQEMANLVRHFDVTVTTQTIESYAAGTLNKYDASFYVGALYDNPIPTAFLQDVLTTTKPICWMGYNLWKVAWTFTNGAVYLNPAFEQKFGVQYWGFDTSGYPQVSYKGVLLGKDQIDPTINYMYVTNTTLASVKAYCVNASGVQAPYITKAGNFWHVADNPFTYVGATDRYLAFADVLFDILGSTQVEQHRALVRIEDVSPVTDPDSMKAVADALYLRGIPFVVSVIPVYTDPFGTWNNGVSETYNMKNVPEFLDALQYMVDHGGKLLLHGYTHQYDTTLNPFTGITGDDFEFYRVTQSSDGLIHYAGSLPGDTTKWVTDRVNKAKKAMTNCGFTPLGWNTPHYTASGLDYKAIASIFKLDFCRGLYFADDTDPTNMYFLQQMAPYVIRKDTYGVKRIPETMGYIDPWGVTGLYPPTLPQDMLTRANANWVVRDGWASFFYHPYLDISYLTQTVDLLKQRGYTFVSVDSSTL